MTMVMARVGVLVAVAALAWLGVALVRHRIAHRRREALAAPPLSPAGGSPGATSMRILAFSTPECTPCHTLQAPALERVRTARPGRVEVVELDAIASPELAERYRIMTVPSTVVLDVAGRPVAVNYSYADTRKLLAQVDAALAAPALEEPVAPG
jgi:thiol-disulfide isomerase/thioredoxin